MSSRQGFQPSHRVFAILLIIGGIAKLAAADPVIPVERTAAWAPGVGFRGGIPARTSLINITNAPYNAKGDGVTDNTAAIQAAINAATANQVVYVPTGKYLCTGTLNLKKSNMSIRGDGPNATIINYMGTGVAISAAPYITAWSARQAVTSAVTQGANQITVTNAGGMAGDIIVISQINPSYATLHGNNGLLSMGGAPNASGGYTNDTTRGMMQVDLVTAVNGNTLTLERPLYLTFASSQSPAINSMTPAYGIGIETRRYCAAGSAVTSRTSIWQRWPSHGSRT